MSQVKESASVEGDSVRSSNRLQQPDAKPREVTGPEVELPAESSPTPGHGGNPLYVGFDLGTSRTSVSASNGSRHTVLSYVGYCKDVIGQKRLGRQTLVGQHALHNRLALDIVRPLKNGVIDVSESRSMAAVKELLGHALSLCKPLPGQPICAVIGAPARASAESQKAILQAVDPLVSSAMVVSEPFAVAYGLNILTEALVIDIGAGTTDLCRMHGTMPEENDQITLPAGGDAVDERLEQEILKRYPKVQLTRNMVRKIKEKHGFVTDPHQKCEITLTEMGRPKKADITDALRVACHSIVPQIVEAIYQLIGTFDPEFQAKLRRNVILAGGGSRLSGLPLLIERDLKDLGGGNVVAVEEPTYAGSNGGLRLAMEMPARYWKALV
ncbi:MAG: rod shape-determining protein [Phycisphaerae bacterium]|nr:rod shape-determining protein [Phycisphaerae bacterium]